MPRQMWDGVMPGIDAAAEKFCSIAPLRRTTRGFRRFKPLFHNRRRRPSISSRTEPVIRTIPYCGSGRDAREFMGLGAFKERWRRTRVIVAPRFPGRRRLRLVVSLGSNSHGVAFSSSSVFCTARFPSHAGRKGCSCPPRCCRIRPRSLLAASRKSWRQPVPWKVRRQDGIEPWPWLCARWVTKTWRGSLMN